LCSLAERGQLDLEQGHVCLLNATALGTEVLKNLTLPGVGQFTIVDKELVSERDLGNNFFVTHQSLGEPRCQVVTDLLLELNEEVKGTAVNQDPVELINESPDFFSKFSCVVVTDITEQALLKLAGHLWAMKIPMCVGRAYGMIGTWRNVLPEVCIIESRPEYTKENYRIASPFPQLEAFVAQYDLDTCKHPHIPLTETPAGPGKYLDSQGRPVVPKAHSHTPAFVLLMKVTSALKARHSLTQAEGEKGNFGMRLRFNYTTGACQVASVTWRGHSQDQC
jgi:amyloid beta precursor protein binding protein 1